jgi:hypothetical protein
MPSLADYRKDLPAGSVRVKENPDGTCNGRVVGREALGRLVEMNEEWRRHEVEHGKEVNAAIPGERLRGPGGVQVLPQAHAAKVARRRGLRPVLDHGEVVLLATGVAGEWCDQCDRLMSWCDCPRGAQ